VTFAATCFSSRRNHHQGAVLCLAKTTSVVFYCACPYRRSECYGGISACCAGVWFMVEEGTEFLPPPWTAHLHNRLICRHNIPPICHTIPRILLCQGSWRTSCDIARKKICIYLWGVTPMHITPHGVAPTAIVEGMPWQSFSVFQIWRFLTGVISPPFVTLLGKRCSTLPWGPVDFLIGLLTGRFLWSPPCQIIDISCSLYEAPSQRPWSGTLHDIIIVCISWNNKNYFEVESVYCAARTNSLYKTDTSGP
jgi:hypothetical protein